MKNKYPGVILFFRLGDFYEMFGRGDTLWTVMDSRFCSKY
ncbi:MAG: hypothetical protein LBD56_00590 [Endomicrobium sp.]|nr:hypothetical protein [Endomicrobium sp.]